jgi:hydrogenase maturation protease
MGGVLVIGIGNPLRGDDGLGWHAAERVQKEFSASEVRVIRCHQLTPELATNVAEADRVIFIDVADADPPGGVFVHEVVSASRAPAALTHNLNPSGLLEYTRTLYGATPNAFLIGINGESFEYSEQLSAPLMAALPLLMRQLKALIRGEHPS